MSQPDKWTAFYETTQGHQPFQTLVKAMALFAAQKKRQATEYFAIDLGCGAGKEVDEDGQTALGEPKHWHVFSVVARKLK